jgi:hypothetical protein
MSLGCYFGNQGFFVSLFRLFTPLLLYIKARTIFAGELIVPMNRRFGVFLLQLLNERFQRRLLLWSSGICKDTHFQ